MDDATLEITPETWDRYRDEIERILHEYTEFPYRYGEVNTTLTIDRDRNRFLLVDEGWQQDGSRLHGCLADVEIRNGKIWVHRDGTEAGVANELVTAGVPKAAIVLGLQPPELRPHTGFGIA